MSSKDSIITGIFKYSVSTWVNLVVGFLSVIVTTRIISPEVYGQVSIFFSVTSVMMYIFTMGLDGALMRFYNDPPNNETTSQMIYKCIMISLVGGLFIGSISTFFWGEFLSNYIFGISRRILIGVMFLYTLSQVILRYLNISYRMSFRARQYTIQNILLNCLSRGLLIMVAFFTDNFVYIAIVLSIGIMLTTFTYTFIQRNEIIPINSNGIMNTSLSLHGYASFFKFALFSAPTYIVVYLNAYINQQLIVSNINTYALGIFASTSMFSAILTGLNGGFSTYWTAYVYKNYENEEEKIKKMHFYVLLFSIIIASGLICFRDVIYLFIGAEFHESKAFFSMLLMGPLLLFVSETTNKGIAIANKNQILLFTHISAIIVNIIGCIILIPAWGLKGAAMSNAISAIVLYILNTFYGQRYYKSIDDVHKSVIGVILLGVILLSAVIFQDIREICLVVMCLDVVAFFIFRSEFDYLIKLLKQKIDNL